MDYLLLELDPPDLRLIEEAVFAALCFAAELVEDDSDEEVDEEQLSEENEGEEVYVCGVFVVSFGWALV